MLPTLLLTGLVSLVAGGLLALVVTAGRRRSAVAPVHPALQADLAAARAELAAVQTELASARAEAADARAALSTATEGRARAEAALEAEQRAAAEKRQLLADTEKALADRFEALSAQALERNNRQFLDLANESYEKLSEKAVGPLAAQLKGVEVHLRELEKARQEAYGKVDEQLRTVSEAHQRLHSETASLVTALRKPATRGQWGEMQLRRAVEIAGLTPHCDFSEQSTIDGADGRVRPDLVVHLPGGKHVIVDAKAPLEAYLDAAEATDETTRRQKLTLHGAQLKKHVEKLSAKAYGEQLRGSSPLVFLFVPGDGILAAAYEADPTLLEYATQRNVMLTSPSLIIGMLHSVAAVWQQEALAENAQQVCDLGKQLYDRLGTMTKHVDKLGRSLNTAVGAYNDTVSSLEARVLVTARKFSDLEVVSDSKGLAAPGVLDTRAKPAVAPELTEPSAGDARILDLDWREEAG